jgi:hypothetical protein
VQRSRLPWAVPVIRAVWAIGFLVGTTTHVIDLAAGGLQAYAAFPTGIRIFWTALTLVDPLVIVLAVVLRRRAGVALGVAVVLADVAVNTVTAATIGGLSAFGLVSQILFGVVVLVTAPVLWRASGRTGRIRPRVGR